MGKILIFVITIILAFNSINLEAQQTDIKHWNYNINIELKDSTLYVSLNLEALKTENWEKNYLLFNRYINIDEAYLNKRPLKYTRSNDTLYFETSSSDEINLSMQYKIPCSYIESSKITKAYGDTNFAYPAQFDSEQIFCERYSKYYPVIYDNLSNYDVKITVPKTYRVFAVNHVTTNKLSGDKRSYTYSILDDDLCFLIT